MTANNTNQIASLTLSDEMLQQLKTALTSSLEAGAVFISALKAEQVQLTQLTAENLNDQLARSVAMKEQAVTLYQNKCEQLFKLITAQGLPATYSGLQDCLSRANTEALARLGQAFGQQIQQAQELNRVNGILVNGQLDNVQGRLQTLLRAVNQEQTETYNAQGASASQSMSTRRTIA